MNLVSIFKQSTAAAALATGLSLSATAMAKPEGKLECIAPADPGGGWDFTCRQFAKVLRDINVVDKNMQTINMTGAAGGVAYAHVVSKRSGDNGLIVAASSSNSTRLAQGQYPGMGENDVTWLGALGADYAVMAVSKDSPYQNLTDVLNQVKSDVKSVRFAGGSGMLGWDQLNLLQVLSKGGISDLRAIKYLDFNNGATAITQILGGHLDVVVGDVSEVTGFVESGDLRVIAVLAADRLPAPFDKIQTAKEQGIDVVAPNWRGFYMPADVSDEEKAFWVDAINQVYQSEEWKALMKQNALMPFNLTGDEFKGFVDQQISDIRAIFDVIKK
jgi:putative tricarboxylic transport membrane protein